MNKLFLTIGLLVSTSLHAKTLELQVGGWGNEKINVIVDVDKAEYMVDMSKLIDYSIKYTQPDDLNCKDLHDFIKGSGGELPLKYYSVPDQLQAKITFTVIPHLSDPTDLESQILKSLHKAGYELTTLHFVTQLLPEEILVDFEWDDESLTLQSGTAVVRATESFIRSSLHLRPVNGFPGRKVLNEVAEKGEATISIPYSPIACDLSEGNLELRLTLNGKQYDDVKVYSPINKEDLSLINSSLSKDFDRLFPKDKFSDRKESIVRSAGLLAYQLQKGSLLEGALERKEFTTLFDAFFESHAFQPKWLSTQDIDSVIDSLATVDFKPTKISKKSKLIQPKER